MAVPYNRAPVIFFTFYVELKTPHFSSKINLKFKGDVKYEADSEGSLLVLLNMSLTQEMKDEGVSREVVNRIQKLKKKAKLVPTDEVTVFYDVPKGYLNDVIKAHFEKIETSVRAKFIAGTCPMFADEIGKF